MKTMPLLLVTLLFAPLLSGCATTGGKMMLKITSEPSSASIVVFDRQGKALGETTTPVSFAVKSEYSYIEIRKDNYSPQRIVIGQDVKKKFNPLYLLNFAVAGAGIGAGIGLNQAAGNHNSQFAETVSYYAFGLGALGLLGAIVDPFAGSLTRISPNSAHITLQAAP
jgi:hypothetical protein